MMPPTSIDGTDITSATIDGTDVQEITVDGQTVFSAIPESLVSRWEYEDDSDTTTAIDSVGSNDGAISGATYTSDSEIGLLALSFDGTDDFVDCGDVAVFETPPFSVAFWMKTSVSDANWDGTQRPMTKVNAGGGFDGWFFIGDLIDGNGGIILQLNGDLNQGVRVESNTAVNDGNYHHVVGTFSSSNAEMKMYVDGNLEDTNSSASPGDISNPAPLTHGARDGGDSSFYQGLLDDPRFYSKVLSDSEVSNLYNTGSIN